MTLELGGKSANVVFADADLEPPPPRRPLAVFGNAGQDCCARSRILVERSARGSSSSAALEAAVESLRVGDPLDDATADGAADLRRPARDGRLLRPRRRPGRDPRRRRPTAPGLLVPADRARSGVELDDRAAREEIFGPVACVIPFADEARGGRDRQRHDLRPVGLDLDAATAPRRCASRGRSRPACCRSTRTPRSGSRRRSAASSSPGVGRELGPGRARALHRAEERLLRDRGG